MYSQIWQNCLDILRKKLSKATVKSWFENIEINEITSEYIEFKVANKFTVDWLTEHYLDILNNIIQEVIGKKLQIKFTYGEKKQNNEETKQIISTKNNNIIQEEYVINSLNNKFTFDNFVVGSCNEFAYEASFAVANSNSTNKFNPLFIYGASGLGKTHLVQAIGNYVLKNNNNLKICYISSENFTNLFIKSLKENTKYEFTSYFRNVDLLLIDDIQFFSGKERTQEEFFHTFNSLHNAGKQIVLTSDRAPSEIKDVEDRLITRFQSGLVVDVQPPDLETRIAIIERKAEFYKFSLPEDVILFIANNFKSNIREIEGVVTKLSAFHSLAGVDINLNITKEVLKDLLPKKSSIYPIDKIIKIVSDFYNIPEKKLIDKGRTKNIAIPRMIAMYLSRELTNETLSTIGLKFGGRDHSTVLNAIEKINKLKKESEDINNNIKQIIHLINIS